MDHGVYWRPWQCDEVDWWLIDWLIDCVINYVTAGKWRSVHRRRSFCRDVVPWQVLPSGWKQLTADITAAFSEITCQATAENSRESNRRAASLHSSMQRGLRVVRLGSVTSLALHWQIFYVSVFCELVHTPMSDKLLESAVFANAVCGLWMKEIGHVVKTRMEMLQTGWINSRSNIATQSKRENTSLM